MNPERLLIYGVAFVIMGLSNAVIPILPELASVNNSDFLKLKLSLLFSAYFFGALITMLPVGILADRLGNLRFIELSIILTAISGLTILLSENLWIILISRFLEGSACGAFFPAAFATLSKSKYPVRYIGEFTFLFNAGLAAGVLFSGLLADTYLKGAIFVFEFITFPLILCLFPIHRKLTHSQNAEEPASLTKLPENLFRDSFNMTIKLLCHNNSRIWISSFLLNGAIGVLIAYYPDYSLGSMTKNQLGSSIASLYICAMVTSLLIGRFRIKEKSIIRIGLIFSVLGAFFVIRYPFLGFSSLGGGSGIALVGFALAVAKMNSERGIVMGLFTTTIYAGLSFAPIIAGLFTSFMSLEKIFLANSCILAAALLL